MAIAVSLEPSPDALVTRAVLFDRPQDHIAGVDDALAAVNMSSAGESSAPAAVEMPSPRRRLR